MDAYRNILCPHWESNHDSSFVRPEAHSQYSSYVYGTCRERAKYRLSALPKGSAVGRALFLWWLWEGCWLPQGRYATTALPGSNFTFTSRTSFTAGAQNQWNTYSFPVSTSYPPRYRIKKKTHIFPLRPAILVRVVPCCVTWSWCGGMLFRVHALINTNRHAVE